MIAPKFSGDGQPRRVLEETFEDDSRVRSTFIYAARFSPDGEWIAYASNETGGFEIYVMRTSDGTNKQRISSAGGFHPIWREDSRELFYWGGNELHGPVMRVAMEREGPGFRTSVPERLFEPTIAGLMDGRNNYAITADGQRFLLRRPSANPSPVNVIVNWFDDLESKVPAVQP